MIDTKAVRDRIHKVALHDNELSEEVANDVAFHMTDWVEDLEALHSFFLHPQSLSDKEVSSLLMQFLVHVPNHVAAAGKLFADMPVTDIFEVGSTTDDDAV